MDQRVQSLMFMTMIIIRCNNNNNNNNNSSSSSSTVSVALEALLRCRLFEIYFLRNSLYFSTMFTAGIMKRWVYVAGRVARCCRVLQGKLTGLPAGNACTVCEQIR